MLFRSVSQSRYGRSQAPVSWKIMNRSITITLQIQEAFSLGSAGVSTKPTTSSGSNPTAEFPSVATLSSGLVDQPSTYKKLVMGQAHGLDISYFSWMQTGAYFTLLYDRRDATVRLFGDRNSTVQLDPNGDLKSSLPEVVLKRSFTTVADGLNHFETLSKSIKKNKGFGSAQFSQISSSWWEIVSGSRSWFSNVHIS